MDNNQIIKTMVSLSVFTTSLTWASIPDDFVDLASIVPNANYEIRYFTDNNFVGQKISGYHAAKCIIQRDAANALLAINDELMKQNKRLKIFDCYRPEKAVAHFMRWVADSSDQKTKAQYYPNLNKADLVGDYIAETSGHSRGYTIDLTLEQKINGQFVEMDMGSPFDLFDTLSNTKDPRIAPQAQQNRQKLKQVMLKHGFNDYKMEWWHFTFKSDPRTTYWDFDVK